MRHRIGRQGGWVGLVVILLALVIVAWLSKDALYKYGVMSGLAQSPKAADTVRGPGMGATAAMPDVTTVTPTPIDALDKARDLQNRVMEQAADQSKRIDDGAK